MLPRHGEAVGMAAFEVMIESPGSASVALKLLVDAESWVEAWREGLRVMGDATSPPDAECVLHADRSLEITVKSTPRRFVVRERPPASEGPAPPGPPLAAGRKTLVRELTEALRRHDPIVRAAVPREPLVRSPAVAAFARPAPLGPAQLGPAPLGPAAVSLDTPTGRSRRPSAIFDDSPENMPAVYDDTARTVEEEGQPDPVARVLSDLEKQRLSARPMRISSQTGLPQPLPVPPENPPSKRQARPELTQLGLAAPRSPAQAQARVKAREEESTAPDAPPARSGLPQMFRAIPSEETTTTDANGVMSLRQAVDMVWQHIPCQLALALKRRADGQHEVVVARGLGEREALACRVSSEDAGSQILRGPGRARYPEGSRRLRFLCGDEVGLDLEVRSSLCAPLIVADGRSATLLLVNATGGAPGGGFDDAQLRAVTYLAKTLSRG